MAKQPINIGTAANDRAGDSLRLAFQKINANFTELYTALGLDVAPLNLGAFEFTGSMLSTTDSTAIVIDQAVSVTSDLTVGGDIVPNIANGGNLGSVAKPWNSLYVSNNTIYIGGTAVGVDANGALTTGGTVVGSTPAWANITGKPTFATVATTGAYADLTGKPTIPTLVSQLANDSGFLTSVGNISNIQSESDVSIQVNLTDSTTRIWRFGEDGDTVFPNNVSINYSGNNVQFPRIIADSGKAFSVQGQGNTGSTAMSWTVDPDAAGQYAAVAVTKVGGDNLAKVVLQAQSDSGDAATVKLWKFDETGRTTFPNGVVPAHSYGAAGDKEGMVVFTDPYIYYCKTDYSTSNGIASVTISTPITRNDSLHWDPATTVIQFATPSGGVAATGTPVFDGSGDLTGINIVTAGSGYLKVVDGGSSNVTDIFIIQTGGTGGNSTREIRNGLPAGVTVSLTTTDIWVRVAWTGTNW